MNQEPNTNAAAQVPIADEAKGLIATLFDFSFSSFVTTKFIKFIYALFLLAAVVGVVGFVIHGFSGGFMTGLLSLLVSPLVAFVYLFLVRMWTEMIVVIFRIAEHLRSIDAKTPPRG
jgi:glycerol-3-phosphate acyltransferase PlsY